MTLHIHCQISITIPTSALDQIRQALQAHPPVHDSIIDEHRLIIENLPNVLTAQDIADFLNIGRKRVYELMQLPPDKGGIRSFSVGKSKRVEKRDFEDWLRQRKVARL